MANASSYSAPETDLSDSNASKHVTGRDNRLSAQLSPPYWQHKRSISTLSQASVQHPPPITLSDNTEAESESPSQSALWAKTVSIDDHVVVQGKSTGLGAYVVWNCQVQTLDGGPMTIRKRYSEFDELREQLVNNFPHFTKTSLPLLPPKSAIYKFRPKFLERRRQGLQYFLSCVMLNPEYAGSDAVKEFIFKQEQ